MARLPLAAAGVLRTQRIYEAIRSQIMSGALGAGAALPSTRSLAAEWGVSRTTVTAAFEQLIAEGYIETRHGARSRVAQGLERAPREPDMPAPRPEPATLSAFGRRVERFPAPPAAGPAHLVADFRYGDLAAGDFPLRAWKKAVNVALARRLPRLRYGEANGLPELREALQGYLWRARGVRCEPDQIVVVNGSQQGLDLCARLLLDRGERAVMENPGYGLARQVFLAAGADVVPVGVDGEGMRTEGLPPARLAYVTPAHQFPLGSIMSIARRRALIAWAESAGAYIVEDDYDSEYRFDVSPIPPLHAMDGGRRVLYIGTVSKTLSPALRLGYVVVPDALAPAFAKAKRLTDRHTSTLEQEALATLIQTGAYERHVRRVRRRNGERRAQLLAALSAALGNRVAVAGADAGLHVVLWLNGVPRAREGEMVQLAQRAGAGVYPITPLYADAATLPRPEVAGLVLGYATLEPSVIAQGVQAIRQALDAFCDLAAAESRS